MLALLSRFGPDIERLERAIDAYRADPTPKALLEMSMAAEARRRQELIRRLNLAPNGIATLVRMRADLLELKARKPRSGGGRYGLRASLRILVQSGLPRAAADRAGPTPADILEKIIRYEAVHAYPAAGTSCAGGLQPEDRRCFAFFHPQLVDDPLIFVEVALTTRDAPNDRGPAEGGSCSDPRY